MLKVRYLLCLLLPVLWCTGSTAQPYSTYGGVWQDNPSRIRVFEDQIVVVGKSATLSSPPVEGFILVTSLALDSLFFKYHIDTLESLSYLDIIERDGGYFVCGNKTNNCCSTGTNAVIMILNSSFEADATIQYGGDYDELFHQVIQLDNHFYFIGYSNSYTTEAPGINSGDPYVVKCNLSGVPIWEKNPGTVFFETVSAAVGNFDQLQLILAGGSSSPGDIYDGYVIKLDTAGNVVWRKLFESGPSRKEFFASVTSSPGGGGLAAGYARSNATDIQGPYFVRFEENGDTLWTKVLYRFNEPATSPYNIRWKNSEVWDAATLSDGSFVVSGNWYNEAHEDQDIFIYKFDQNGDSLWRIDLGDQYGHDKGWAITVHEDYIYVAGNYVNPQTENGLVDVLLIKLDADGCTVDTCLVSVPPALQSSTKPFTLYPNPTDNVIRVQLETSAFHKGELIISDPSGRHVFHQAVSNNASVSVHTLPQGVYIAELKLKNGERYFQRFVKL